MVEEVEMEQVFLSEYFEISVNLVLRIVCAHISFLYHGHYIIAAVEAELLSEVLLHICTYTISKCTIFFSRYALKPNLQ
jgi:hypothetical protein